VYNKLLYLKLYSRIYEDILIITLGYICGCFPYWTSSFAYYDI